MKTKAKLLALALLALPVGTQAQQHLEKLFEKIADTKGIEVSKSQNIVRNDEDGNQSNDLMEATTVYNIRVGRANFNIFKELEKAFQTSEDTPTTIYTCFNPMDESLRQQWSILTKKGNDIRIGQHKGSSYALVVYPDNNPRFRTVYAAEWWDTDDTDIKQGRLIRSYGEKPEMHSETTTGKNIGDLTAGPFNGTDFSGQDIEDLLNQARQLQHKFQWRADTVATDIPLTGSMGDWMSKAIKNIKHLSNSDWRRFFGLVTEKMMDRNKNDSAEDMVVAAGIVLDLCKNADQLDDDERAICARRLEQVVTALKNMVKGDQYVYDMLMLGAKKLVKNN